MDLADALLAPFRQARRHLLWILGLILARVFLSQLAPALQWGFDLPTDLRTQGWLALVTVLIPLDLYLIPRLICALDGELNLEADWRAKFDRRWLLMAWTKLSLYLVVMLGFSLVVLPGLLVLFAFGWGPHRVLLRNEHPLLAMRRSLTQSFTSRFTMLTLGSFFALAAIAAVLLIALFMVAGNPNPTPLEKLRHAPIWIGQLALGIVELAFSILLLGLFRFTESRASFTSQNTP